MSAASLAQAQPATQPSAQERARAEALFREAKDLMAAEKFGEACPKFAESYQLDPAPGTLLNLGVCHEKDGKIASAWTDFVDAESLAKRDNQPEREAYARKKAEALQAQLSYLRVTVSPAVQSTPGLEVKLDGSPLRKSSWGSKLPVDPGEHVIEAQAPDHKAYQGTVTVGKGPSEATFEVPALTPEPKAAVPVVPLVPAAPPAEQAPASPKGKAGQTQRLAGYITAGVGVVGLGLGTAFGLRTLSLKSDRDGQCDATGCSREGVQFDKSARSSATLSTVSFIAGGALLAGGVALVLTAPSGEPRATFGVAPLAGGGFVHSEMSW